MIIENIQFAKLVDRAAVVTEEIVAVHEYANRVSDPVKKSLAQLQFKTVVDRYTALVSGLSADRLKEFGQRVEQRMDEMQLDRAEQMQRVRQMYEQQREELAMLGLIAA